MKIYNSSVAPNPRRVRIFLAEKKIPITYQEVDLAKAENRQPEFRKINPLAAVPVLELDDGTHIAESVAICRYFEELHPEPPLMGVGTKERAIVEMWQRRMEFTLLGPIADAFRLQHEFFKGRIRQCPEYAAIRKEDAVQRLQWLDGELADRPFVAGEKFTIADITALVAIDFGRLSAIRIQSDQKHLSRWHQDVSSRASAKA
ncbi:MAG TPA: glutathione S-transferase family protein [Candidatus Binataceae bacterium]|nr:glutathione S-transferase family protein [Candidatus Binataceae bacterium]